MPAHEIEREYVGKGKVWLDCSCGWFLCVRREDEQTVKQTHKSEPDESDEYRGPGCDATCGC